MSPQCSSQQPDAWIQSLLMPPQHPIPTPTKIQILRVPRLRGQTSLHYCPQINMAHNNTVELFQISRLRGQGYVGFWEVMDPETAKWEESFGHPGVL